MDSHFSKYSHGLSRRCDVLVAELSSAYGESAVSIQSLMHFNECADYVYTDIIQQRSAHNLITWRSVPSAWIEYNYEAIPIIPPQHMAVFLPAYIHYCLCNLFNTTNVIDFLVYSLAAAGEAPCYAQKFSLLNPVQGRVVLSFLGLLEEHGRSGLQAYVQRAITTYWEQFATPSA